MDRKILEKRPAVVIVGAPNVGKRTLLSRLLSLDIDDDSSSELLVHGWTINTKYYSADISVWTAHLSEDFSISRLPVINRIVALVMVFDVNDTSSFAALKSWVSRTDIQNFDILLCISNKVDLVPGHPAHIEYKRRLLKREESSAGPHTDFSEYGISEAEGSSLLGDDEPLTGNKTACFEWCLENNIEYVEACACNADFDKCLSVDGDSQGIERLHGALSAHMWPGMLLKSGDKINEPSLPVNEEELSEEESDYELEYEILSSGSAEPWDDVGWMSADGTSVAVGSSEKDIIDSLDKEMKIKPMGIDPQASTSKYQLPEELDNKETRDINESEGSSEPDESSSFAFGDLEKLMSEIGNVRSGLRLMPDFQRREMAAKVAMKMAAMFGDSSGGEEGFD